MTSICHKKLVVKSGKIQKKDGGTSGPVNHAETGSKDPHRRERTFFAYFFFNEIILKLHKKLHKDSHPLIL